MCRSPFIYFFCCSVFLIFTARQGYSQTSTCPANIDFSSGSFANWECRTGIVSGNGGQNTATWLGTGEVSDRHHLIAPTSGLIDPYGEFPQHCPNSNSYSVRLGNDNNGHEAEGLFYTFTIPATNTKFSLLYYYAIVLQNPGHNTHEQPRFRARVIDVATETEINCVSFDFSSSGSLPGFKPTRFGNAVYKDWTPISVDLSVYAGKTIRLEFITSDCVFQEHFGYAYINVASICNGSILGNNYCEGDSTTTVTAPHGFQQYLWYSDTTFNRQISQAQELSLDIRTTPVGTVLPVLIVPYPGYGCADTLYAIIGLAQKPVSYAGIDKISCSKATVQLGTSPVDTYSYTWAPKDILLNPFVANPSTVPGILAPTDFIVKTTDLLNGCFSFDTVTVTPLLVDTSSSVTGQMIYCPGETLNTTLSVNNTGNTVQWFRANSLIVGATNFSYQPSTVGTYWAEIRQSGCIDSSRQYKIHQAALPKPDFIMNKEVQCLNEPIVFTNKTTIAGNEPVRYLWRFNDGQSSSAINAEQAFNKKGVYTTTLIATTGTACIDSIQKQVMIVNECVPILPTAFTPNRDGKNDDLKPLLAGAKGLKRFTVYNRWGNIVFSTTKEGEGWNGSYNGMPIQTSVLVWIVEYISKDNRIITQKGTVTLIR